MTEFLTDICEQFYNRLEARKADGQFRQTPPRTNTSDTWRYLKEALGAAYSPLEMRVSVAKTVITNAAEDGKDYVPLVHTLDGYCFAMGLGRKNDDR